MILLSQAGRKSSVTDTRAWSKRALPSVFWAPPTKHTQVLKWINAEPQLYMWIKLCPFQVMSLCLIHARFSKAPKHSPNKSRSLKILNHDSKSEIHTKLGLVLYHYYVFHYKLTTAKEYKSWYPCLTLCVNVYSVSFDIAFFPLHPHLPFSPFFLSPSDATCRQNKHFKTCVCVCVYVAKTSILMRKCPKGECGLMRWK